MKRFVLKRLPLFVLISACLLFTACGSTAVAGSPAEKSAAPSAVQTGTAPSPAQTSTEPGVSPADTTPAADNGQVSGEFDAALHDWILGTSYGITAGTIDQAKKIVTLNIPAEALEKLSDQDKADIKAAMNDMLTVFLGSASAAQSYGMQFASDGTVVTPSAEASASPEPSAASPQPSSDSSTVNLVFIHHSCGENWLNGGLNKALNDNGYHVADIYYGWREYGDNTDIIHWPNWFKDDVMSLVYNELGTMTASNTIPAAAGENTVVMFKSCFPNSDVGDSIDDEKAVYNSLLPYFEAHPDKMFILCTSPPMIKISTPLLTRELCNWLADRDTGWLSGLKTGNVFVFDFYNVLTHPNAHHAYVDGKELHTAVAGTNELYYDSAGDDHPNAEGNTKATQEYMGLLKVWYQQFKTK